MTGRSVGRPRVARRLWVGLIACLALAVSAGGALGASPQYMQQGSAITPDDATASAFFGVAVALSADGDTALVGGRQNSSSSGAAWVFVRSGSTWTQQATLHPSDETGAGLFGSSVALSADGNTALVGGPLDSSTAGAAWVFVRSGTSWSQEGSKLTPSDETGPGYFGSSVALSSDASTALIGALNDNSANGAGWVFVRSGSTWAQQGSKLTPNDANGAANFGSGVGLSSDGSTAVIGGDEDAGGVGAAWAFTRSGATWSQQGSKLTASDETGHGEFGDHVSLSGDGNTAVIGAPLDNSNAGGAWVFSRSGTTWSQQGSKLHPSDDSGQPQFGSAVAISSDGGTALIGGPLHSATGEQGAAWVFTPSSGGWTQDGSRLLETGTSGGTSFGASTALSSDASTALIGGPATNLNDGAAWVFVNPTGGGGGGSGGGGGGGGSGGGGTGSCTFVCVGPQSRTLITSGPDSFTPSAPTFTFASDEPGVVTFECHFDNEPWQACTTPLTRFGLAYGPHTFYVRYVSSTGARDPNPASQSFTLGEETLTGGCTIFILWADWDSQQGQNCVALRQTCPMNSLCTQSGTLTVTSADKNVQWDGLLYLAFGGTEDPNPDLAPPFGTGYQVTAFPSPNVACAYPNLPAFSATYVPCPKHTAPFTHLGMNDLAHTMCNSYFIGGNGSIPEGVTPVRGPDAQRKIVCTATLKIQPAEPLGIVSGGGPQVALAVPGPGQLIIGAPQAPARDAAAARQRRKPRRPFAPVRLRVARAGLVTVTLKLSRKAAAVLQHRHTLALRMLVSFTPTGGRTMTRIERATLIAPAPVRRCRAHSRRHRCR